MLQYNQGVADVTWFISTRPKREKGKQGAMANQELVKMLRENFPAFNALRAANPDEPIDLSGANLFMVDLSGANLSVADLSGANLSVADLSGADLSGANLSEANLSEAKLYGAKLFGADLTGAKGLTAEQLAHTCFFGASGIPKEMAKEALRIVLASLVSDVPAA